MYTEHDRVSHPCMPFLLSANTHANPTLTPEHVKSPTKSKSSHIPLNKSPPISEEPLNEEKEIMAQSQPSNNANKTNKSPKPLSNPSPPKSSSPQQSITSKSKPSSLPQSQSQSVRLNSQVFSADLAPPKPPSKATFKMSRAKVLKQALDCQEPPVSKSHPAELPPNTSVKIPQPNAMSSSIELNDFTSEIQKRRLSRKNHKLHSVDLHFNSKKITDLNLNNKSLHRHSSESNVLSKNSSIKEHSFKARPYPKASNQEPKLATEKVALSGNHLCLDVDVNKKPKTRFQVKSLMQSHDNVSQMKVEVTEDMSDTPRSQSAPIRSSMRQETFVVDNLIVKSMDALKPGPGLSNAH